MQESEIIVRCIYDCVFTNRVFETGVRVQSTRGNAISALCKLVKSPGLPQECVAKLQRAIKYREQKFTSCNENRLFVYVCDEGIDERRKHGSSRKQVQVIKLDDAWRH